MLKVSIYGCGYVGLVTGSCFAELGHHVVCYDIDEAKINALNQKKIPIFEAGLDSLIENNTRIGRLVFSSDIKRVTEHGDYHLIAVGTPQSDDGHAKLDYVFSALSNLASYAVRDGIIINKSTVPVGTASRSQSFINERLKDLKKDIRLDVVSNPEFLREGSAVQDFMEAERIIIGSQNQQAIKSMIDLYQPLIDRGTPFLAMDPYSSELSKYASNAMLACKISFINEMSQIAEHCGADITKVSHAMSFDHRIGKHFINAGCGYGGSCFPKDVRALRATAEALKVHPQMLIAIDETNDRQKCHLFNQLTTYFEGNLQNKTIALWGLSFKPNTNDTREAVSLKLIESLAQCRVAIKAYDPVVKSLPLYENESALTLCDNAYLAAKDADALVVVTEWDEFKHANLELLKSSMNNAVIFDGRNIFDKIKTASLDMIHIRIGEALPNHNAEPSFEA